MPTSRELFEAALLPELQHQIVGSLCAAARRRPLSPLYVVAPSAAIVEHIARTCAREAQRVVHVRALSWEALAATLTAAERRAEGRGRLSGAAAAWQVRQFLAHERRPRGFFDRALGVRGFRAAMLRSFDDLAMAGLVEADDVERFLVQHGNRLRPRLRHVLELLLGYRRSFESQRDDRAAVIVRAARVPAGRVGAVLQARELWVYGFEDLAPVELRLLAHLARDPDLHVRVFVPIPAGRETGLGVRLEESGFDRAPLSVDASTDTSAGTVSLVALSAPGEESEVDEVTRHIVHAADEGVAYERMAVVARQPQTLALLQRRLVRADVPCTLLAGRPLATTRTGRALVQLLDLLDVGMRPASVLSFLNSAPLRWRAWCGIGDDPTPSAWERVAHEACLGHGWRDWQPKLQRVQASASERARVRRESDEPSRREEATVSAADELLRVAQRLDRDLRRFPRRARWSDFVSAVRAFVDEAFDTGPETHAVLEVLQRLRDLDGLSSPRPTRQDFRDLARTLLGDARLTDAAAARPGVRLGTPSELYGMDFDVVCVLGLQEGEWPGPVSEDPILPDVDRRALAEALGTPGALPPGARRAERERRSFRAATQSARARLLVSFARLDAGTAAARLPSGLLLELAEERAGRELDFAGFEKLDWLERVPLRRVEPPHALPVLSRDEFDTLAIAGLTRRAARRYVRRLGVMPARGLALDTLRNTRARFTAYDGWLGSDTVRRSLRQAFDRRVYSASQLATYVTCPFRYFMRHALRVEPLDRDTHRELNALEIGRLVHTTLERFYRDLAQREVQKLDACDFDTLREALLRALEDTCAEIENQGRQGAPVLWDIRKQHLRDDLVRFLHHEVERAAGDEEWLPTRFEFRFGPGCTSTLKIARPERRPLVFRGIIDRIDRLAKHDGLRVVDYKSGRKAFAGRNPQAVQLVLYLWAACEGDASRLERSEGRFVYVTRRGAFDVQAVDGARVQARASDLSKLARAVADGIEGGVFFPQPGPNAVHCTVCDYRGLCDARIAHQATMKSRGGQDEAHRSLPDFGEELQSTARERDGGR